MISFEDVVKTDKEALALSVLDLFRDQDNEKSLLILSLIKSEEEREGRDIDMLEQAALVAGVYGGSPAYWLEQEPAWSFFAAARHIYVVRNERMNNLVDAGLLSNPQVAMRVRRDVMRRREPPLQVDGELSDVLRSRAITAPRNTMLLASMGVQVVTDG